MDELQGRLDEAVQEFAAGNISASMLGRIETELSRRIEQSEPVAVPLEQIPMARNQEPLTSDGDAAQNEAMISGSFDELPSEDEQELTYATASWEATSLSLLEDGLAERAIRYRFEDGELIVGRSDEAMVDSLVENLTGQAPHFLPAAGSPIIEHAVGEDRGSAVGKDRDPSPNAQSETLGLEPVSGVTARFRQASAGESDRSPNRAGAPPRSNERRPAVQRSESGRWNIVVPFVLLALIAIGVIYGLTSSGNAGDAPTPTPAPAPIDPELADFERRWANAPTSERSQLCLEFNLSYRFVVYLTESQNDFLRSKC